MIEKHVTLEQKCTKGGQNTNLYLAEIAARDMQINK